MQARWKLNARLLRSHYQSSTNYSQPTAKHVKRRRFARRRRRRRRRGHLRTGDDAKRLLLLLLLRDWVAAVLHLLRHLNVLHLLRMHRRHT